MNCELCGTPVKVVGDTTKHYKPIAPMTAYFYQKQIKALEAKVERYEKALREILNASCIQSNPEKNCHKIAEQALEIESNSETLKGDE